MKKEFLTQEEIKNISAEIFTDVKGRVAPFFLDYTQKNNIDFRSLQNSADFSEKMQLAIKQFFANEKLTEKLPQFFSQENWKKKTGTLVFRGLRYTSREDGIEELKKPFVFNASRGASANGYGVYFYTELEDAKLWAPSDKFVMVSKIDDSANFLDEGDTEYIWNNIRDRYESNSDLECMIDFVCSGAFFKTYLALKLGYDGIAAGNYSFCVMNRNKLLINEQEPFYTKPKLDKNLSY